jgi:hypothetical protein
VDKRSITSQTKNSRHQQPNQDQIEKKDKNGARLGMSAGDLPPAAARPPPRIFFFHFIRMMKKPDQSNPSQLKKSPKNVYAQSIRKVSHFWESAIGRCLIFLPGDKASLSVEMT